MEFKSGTQRVKLPGLKVGPPWIPQMYSVLTLTFCFAEARQDTGGNVYYYHCRVKMLTMKVWQGRYCFFNLQKPHKTITWEHMSGILRGRDRKNNLQAWGGNRLQNVALQQKTRKTVLKQMNEKNQPSKDILWPTHTHTHTVAHMYAHTLWHKCTHTHTMAYMYAHTHCGIYTHMHTCINYGINTHALWHICMHNTLWDIFLHTNMHNSIHIYTHGVTYMHAHTMAFTYAQTYIYTQWHICMHSHIHTLLHICMNTYLSIHKHITQYQFFNYIFDKGMLTLNRNALLS